MEFIRLRGIGVSFGIAMGETFVTETSALAVRRETVPASQIKKEIERLKLAIEKTEGELLEIKEKIEKLPVKNKQFFLKLICLF